MQKLIKLLSITIVVVLFSCNQQEQTSDTTAAKMPAGGQEKVTDDVSQKDIVKVAMGSKDHSTLVAALKQADLVTSLSNAGPFTVFAPTNAAFDKIPKETLDALMKDDKKTDLQNVLQYHVTLATLKIESFHDGQVLGMVNGDNVTVSIKDGKVILNNSAVIIASIPASNGIIHVIDGVLLPASKK
jgi:uncharacterized surface protein with fasciclin (FAS1) repeats